MGGPAINKDKLRDNILVQNKPYTPDAIAMSSNVSRSAAYMAIKELIGEGKVILDSKDGHKMIYATVSGAGQTQLRKGTNMSSLTPSERMGYISHLVDMILSGISPSLLITGIAGIGKTYLVKERLKANDKEEGIDFHICNGYSTPMGLYKYLHDHRDSTVIFDDCDSVFKELTSVNILKSALDSYDVRKVCWQSTKMPEDLEPSFDFTGQIIFISNMDASRVDEAVTSRTIVIDLQMSRREICEHLKTLVGAIEPKMKMDSKKEVLDYLGENCEAMAQFNIRTFIKACRIRRTADLKGYDWKKMVMVLN